MSNIDLNNLPKEKFVLVNEDKKLHDKELVTKPVGFFKDAMNRFARNKGSIVAAIVIGVLILFAIIAPIVSPYKVSYSDNYYSYLLPKVFDNEYIDFLDGAKNVDTNFVTFIEHYSKGAENGYNAIKRQSYTYNEKTDKYHYRLDTYNAVGTVFMKSISRSDYYDIQKYQDKTGVQIIYPITDVNKRPKNQKNVDNANIWYETEADPQSTNDIPANYTIKDDGTIELKNIYKTYTTPVLSATSTANNSARAMLENKDGGYAIKIIVKANASYGGSVLKEDQTIGYLGIEVENGTANGTFLEESLDKAAKFEYDSTYHAFKTLINGHTNPEDNGYYFYGLPFTQGTTVNLYKESELTNDEIVPLSLYENKEIVDAFELNKEYEFAINRDKQQITNYYATDIMLGTINVSQTKANNITFEQSGAGYLIKVKSGKFYNYIKVTFDGEKNVFSSISAVADATVWTYDNTTGYLKAFVGGHSDASLDKEYVIGFNSEALTSDMYDENALPENVFPYKVAPTSSFDLVDTIDESASYRLAYRHVIRNDKFFYVDGNFKGDSYFSKMRIEGDNNYLYDYAIQKDGDQFEIRVCYYEYYRYYHSQILHDRITKPYFLFGTTKTGQDIFTCLSSGARFSFILAILVSSVNLIVGAIYGAIEGYYGGKVDMIMERIVEILSAVPFMIVITLLKYHMTKTPAALLLFIAFFLTGWIGMSGVVRMQFYRFKNQEYVLAARTLGARDPRIMFKHIFPNALGTIVTSCVLVIPGMIFSETSLSYLGIINLNSGDMTSVGTLLADAQGFIDTYPHMILFPAVFISLLMLSFNLFGNGLRDAFNPSLRGTEDQFMATENKLQVKNLQISFKTQAGILKAVRNISFDLKAGETLAIVGESGSGKSVTSKAIIGILAGNSIVEGGEILYDGQDLLKIDEEHFHKIRGDKIAMIFQDPLSSLNPIMRVGRQLNEAMILNGRARQKNSRIEFNSHLKLLKQNLDEVNGNSQSNSELCDTFDNFCIISTHLEKKYNAANASAVTLKTELNETAFLIEKKQKVAVKKQINLFIKLANKAIDPYVLHEDEVSSFVSEVTKFKDNKENENDEPLLACLKSFSEIVNQAIERQHPNFFRLGYCKYANPNFNEFSYASIDELDSAALQYLEDNFMKRFIEVGTTGMQNSRNVSIEKKKVILSELNSLLSTIENIENADKKAFKKGLKKIYKAVNDAIDYLRVKKHSVEYSFKISLDHEVKRYYEGIKRNPINIRKYERSKAKYDKLVEQGKTPTWKVIPPYTVDLTLTKNNMIKIVGDLIDRYEKDLSSTNTYDAHAEMVELIDFFKEQASRLVYRVTLGIAKARSLELLKEVGIPEPSIRYKQYPFEFSGGMRQRIVIAIALSANPDILICDEPTTALDVTIQSQILELINKIKKERNLSIIFITHDLGVVANMADRIAVMYAGKIVEYGTSEDIFYDPKHPYTWALLSSMPDLETKEKLEAIPGTPPNMIYPPVGDAFAERNKYALEIDYEMEPPFFKVSDTHYAATWLLHPNAPKVEPPKIIRERIARMKKEAEQL